MFLAPSGFYFKTEDQLCEDSLGYLLNKNDAHIY